MSDRHSEVKFAQINAASSGDNTIVAAVAGRRIVVLDYMIVAAGAVVARWEDGASSGTYLSGPLTLAGNGGISTHHSPLGKLRTSAGALLNLELSGAITIGGHLTYVEELVTEA